MPDRCRRWREASPGPGHRGKQRAKLPVASGPIHLQINDKNKDRGDKGKGKEGKSKDKEGGGDASEEEEDWGAEWP